MKPPDEVVTGLKGTPAGTPGWYVPTPAPALGDCRLWYSYIGVARAGRCTGVPWVMEPETPSLLWGGIWRSSPSLKRCGADTGVPWVMEPVLGAGVTILGDSLACCGVVEGTTLRGCFSCCCGVMERGPITRCGVEGWPGRGFATPW